MKRALLALAVSFWITPLFAEWTNLLETDLQLVIEESAAEGKAVYIAFLGRGWSMASDGFEKTVLSHAAFLDFAASNLTLCEVPARVRPKLPKAAQARLQALVIHFDVKAYPTFLLLAPDGSEILRHGRRDIMAEEYVDLLRAILPSKHEGG